MSHRGLIHASDPWDRLPLSDARLVDYVISFSSDDPDMSEAMPEPSEKDIAFLEGLGLFVFPLGQPGTAGAPYALPAAVGERSVHAHSFVLTDEVGVRRYGCVVTSTTRIRGQGEPHPQRPTDFEWRTAVVVSRWPFLRTFNDMLTRLVDEWIARGSEAFVQRCSYILFEIPLPPADGTSVSFPFCGASFTARRLPSYPLSQASVAGLASHLGPGNLVNVFASLLLERSVLVYADDYTALTPACEALHVLVFPLLWEEVYVPLLPEELSAVAESPSPYIIGMQSRTAVRLVDELDEYITCVDLDGDTVSHISQLPRARHLRLVAAVRKATAADKTPADVDRELRDVFAAFMRELLESIAPFVTATDFRTEEFVAAADPADRDFLRGLVSTAMFCQHVDRCARRLVDEGVLQDNVPVVRLRAPTEPGEPSAAQGPEAAVQEQIACAVCRKRASLSSEAIVSISETDNKAFVGRRHSQRFLKLTPSLCPVFLWQPYEHLVEHLSLSLPDAAGSRPERSDSDACGDCSVSCPASTRPAPDVILWMRAVALYHMKLYGCCLQDLMASIIMHQRRSPPHVHPRDLVDVYGRLSAEEKGRFPADVVRMIENEEPFPTIVDAILAWAATLGQPLHRHPLCTHSSPLQPHQASPRYPRVRSHPGTSPSTGPVSAEPGMTPVAEGSHDSDAETDASRPRLVRGRAESDPAGDGPDAGAAAAAAAVTRGRLARVPSVGEEGARALRRMSVLVERRLSRAVPPGRGSVSARVAAGAVAGLADAIAASSAATAKRPSIALAGNPTAFLRRADSMAVRMRRQATNAGPAPAAPGMATSDRLLLNMEVVDDDESLSPRGDAPPGPFSPVELSIELMERLLELYRLASTTVRHGFELIDSSKLAMVSNTSAYRSFLGLSSLLAKVSPTDIGLADNAARFCFFMNVRSTLLLHSILALGAPQTHAQWQVLHSIARYQVCGIVMSVELIDRAILRAPMPPALAVMTYASDTQGAHAVDETIAPLRLTQAVPGMALALADGTAGGPIFQVYRPGTMQLQLTRAGTEFCNEQIVVMLESNKILLPAHFKWYQHDFGEDKADIFRWICQNLPKSSFARQFGVYEEAPEAPAPRVSVQLTAPPAVSAQQQPAPVSPRPSGDRMGRSPSASSSSALVASLAQMTAAGAKRMSLNNVALDMDITFRRPSWKFRVRCLDSGAALEKGRVVYRMYVTVADNSDPQARPRMSVTFGLQSGRQTERFDLDESQNKTPFLPGQTDLFALAYPEVEGVVNMTLRADGLQPGHFVAPSQVLVENTRTGRKLLFLVRNRLDTKTPEVTVEPEFVYQITLKTGDMKDAGMNGIVALELFGATTSSGVFTLSQAHYKFEPSKSDVFTITTKADLGALKSLRIRIEGTSFFSSNKWYLDYGIVENVLTKQITRFVCKKWLSVEEDPRFWFVLWTTA